MFSEMLSRTFWIDCPGDKVIDFAFLLLPLLLPLEYLFLFLALTCLIDLLPLELFLPFVSSPDAERTLAPLLPLVMREVRP